MKAVLISAIPEVSKKLAFYSALQINTLKLGYASYMKQPSPATFT